MVKHKNYSIFRWFNNMFEYSFINNNIIKKIYCKNMYVFVGYLDGN